VEISHGAFHTAKSSLKTLPEDAYKIITRIIPGQDGFMRIFMEPDAIKEKSFSRNMGVLSPSCRLHFVKNTMSYIMGLIPQRSITHDFRSWYWNYGLPSGYIHIHTGISTG